MKFNKILSVVAAALLMCSCEKSEIDPALDLRPEVPVMITNATEFRPDPTVTTSLSGDNKITIALAIPEGSNRKIAEITRIAASTSYTKIQSGGSTGYYQATPIPVNGTSFTYNTSISEYFAKFPVSASNPAAKANTELALRLYFLVKLDDGTELVSMPVRVLVLA